MKTDKPNLNGHHYMALIRHGERVDRCPEENKFEYDNKIDPPLSKVGVGQGIEAGHVLTKYFEEHSMEFDDIVILSSPFTRCLQTANGIAKGLNKKEVIVDYLICEHL